MAPSFSCTAPSCKFLLFSSSKLSKKTSTRCHPLLKQQQQQQRQQQANWASLCSEINTHVLKSLPTTPTLAVAEPMQHLVSATPPSVAPALCLAACELVGERKEQAMSAACAIQLMHAAVHTHNQLLRPGSVPNTIAPRIQLMIGDAIMPLAYGMIAGGDSTNNHEKVLRVITEITRAMGPRGVGEGQLLEAEGSGESGWAWERKGGTLSACAAACGAILGGGSEEDVEKMRRFGWHVGMMNEMFSSEDAASCGEVAETFRSLARLELQGFEKKKVDAVLGLFLDKDSWRSPGDCLSLPFAQGTCR